nr:PREDICTED: L-threonine dehydratase catabolic TdcB-like isoform X1 [Latimeria chalumnae]|eukprot:XP_014347771.1 PREDICTED: L-threonine dehydratase catabolic TdcB-like isoform X1 [Latimeria chalumnae]
MQDQSKYPLSLEMLRTANKNVKRSPLKIIHTPMLNVEQTTITLGASCNLLLKLENMQTTGSFKIRGIANQFANKEGEGHFITMSAGNYGKSFAHASKHYGFKGKVLMPETAPSSRSSIITSYGVEVEWMPSIFLKPAIDKYVKEQNGIFTPF